MSDTERLLQARRLNGSADEDLRAARSSIDDGDFRPRHPCLFAQQAAEKALKAALTFDNVRFPWKHDLDLLRALLPARWSLVDECPDLTELSAWSVAARYPSDLPAARERDAQRSIEVASTVFDAITADLVARGVEPYEWTAPDEDYADDPAE